jgi:hypothetical protein
MGKSAPKGTKVYDYYGTIAAVVCAGPVDVLTSVIIDAKVVWSGTLTRAAAAYDDVTITGYGIMRIYWGTDAQVADDVLKTANNDKSENHPDYKGVCYVILGPLAAGGKKPGFLFGRERTSAPNVEVVVRRKANQSIVTGDPSGFEDTSQANLAAVLAEVLTSRDGLGLADGALDDSHFQQAAEKLHDRSSIAAASPLLDGQTTFRAFWQTLLALIDASLRYNPSDQQIEPHIYNHGVPPGDFDDDHTLTVDKLTERPAFKAQGWKSAFTGAVVTFCDKDRIYKDSSEKVDDIRAYQVIGEHRRQDLQRPAITRRSQALSHAAETLRCLGRPQMTGTLSVRREMARAIYPGDYVLADIDLEPGGAVLNAYFRVIDRTIPFTGPIKFGLDADETLAAVPYTPTPAPTNVEEAAVPEIANLRIIEAPAQLAELVPSVLVLAERPSLQVVQMELWYDSDSGGDFQSLGSQTSFALRATLTADIDADDVTVGITVPAQEDTSRLDEEVSDLLAGDDNMLAILVDIDTGAVDEDANGYAIIEVCSISAIALVSGSNYNLTVLRGRRGTTGRAFLTTTAEVWLIPRALLPSFHHADFAALRANRVLGDTPDTAYFRVQPFTLTAQLALADCNNVTFQFAPKLESAPRLILTAPTETEFQWPPDWVANTSYVIGDFVWEAGTFYRCKTANSDASFTVAKWDNVSSPTAWAANTAYSVGDVRGYNGNAFLCASAHTSAIAWVTSTVYAVDDIREHSGSQYRCLAAHTSGSWDATKWVLDAELDVVKWTFINVYSHEVDITGEWVDPDGDMVSAQIFLQKDSDAEVMEEETAFAPTGSYSFSETVNIQGNGYWTIRLVATDAAGLTGETKIRITGVGTWNKVARPKFSQHGSTFKGEEWNRYGKFKLKCKTDGATIKFRYAKRIGAVDYAFGPWHDYDADGGDYLDFPVGYQPTDAFDEIIEAYATKGGYTDSDVRRIEIKFKRVSDTGAPF